MSLSKWSLTWSRTHSYLEAYIGTGAYQKELLKYLGKCGLTEPQIQQVMQSANEQRQAVIGRVQGAGTIANWAKNQVGANSLDLAHRVTPVARQIMELADIK